jgi:nucleoside-diphosphate-sugar epimerase
VILRRVRVVVLGGTGFLGSRVTRFLAEHDHEVTVVHRGTTKAELPSTVGHVLMTFAEFSEQSVRIALSRPDVVLDMVPYLDKRGHGVLGFRGVAERGVVVTSCDVYRAFGRLWRSEPGVPDPVPLTESSPLRAKRAPDIGVDETIDYDNLEVECAVAGVPDLPMTILRLPATYGPGDPQHRLAAYVRRMVDARPAIVLDCVRANWRWTRGYVDNVAAAIALAVEDERATGQTYNMGALNAHTEAEWIRRVGDVMGWQGQVVALPAEQLPPQLRTRYDYTQDLVIDSSKLRRELEFNEVAAEDDGLAATIAWQRKNLREAIDADYTAEDDALKQAF